MAAWRREAEALLAEIGLAHVVWVPWGAPPPSAGAIAVSLLGLDPTSAERGRTFAALAAIVAPGASLVVVDHNRPRSMPAALVALGAAPWLPGCTPSRRWRRLARPTAREIQAAGFRVECLRFVVAERVQIVVAIRT